MRYRKGPISVDLMLDEDRVVLTWRDGNTAPDTEEIVCEGPLQARFELDKKMAELVTRGFTREPEGANEDHTSLSDTELEEAIAAHPDDPAPYLVYADWLQRAGDPRGELIMIQHAFVEHTEQADQTSKLFTERAQQLRRAEAALLHRHRKHLFGETLAQLWDVSGQSYYVDVFNLEWFCGFVRKATGRVRSLKRAGDETPVWRHLLDGPSGKFIQEITMEWLDAPELRPGTPETLHTLCFELGTWWPPEYEENEPEAVYSGGYYTYDPEHLDDTIGPAPRILQSLGEVLYSDILPGLRHLRFRGSLITNELVETLASLSLTAQLETLDLSGGSLTDRGARALLAQSKAYRHLQLLDLRRNRLSTPQRRELEGICKEVLV